MRHLFFRVSSSPRGILGSFTFPFAVSSWHDDTLRDDPCLVVYKARSVKVANANVGKVFRTVFNTLDQHRMHPSAKPPVFELQRHPLNYRRLHRVYRPYYTRTHWFCWSLPFSMEFFFSLCQICLHSYKRPDTTFITSSCIKPVVLYQCIYHYFRLFSKLPCSPYFSCQGITLHVIQQGDFVSSPCTTVVSSHLGAWARVKFILFYPTGDLHRKWQRRWASFSW